MKKTSNVIGWLLLFTTVTVCASAKTIGVLNFELTDTTLAIDAQHTLQEKLRTESIKPLLIKALGNGFQHKIVAVDDNLQNEMNEGINYIFSHPDVAAELGQKVGADYIIVGRLHKPSYLFAYLIALIVDVKKGKVIAYHKVEAKGKLMQATQKSVASLATKIIQTIN